LVGYALDFSLLSSQNLHCLLHLANQLLLNRLEIL
jgi:hypothetical protein